MNDKKKLNLIENIKEITISLLEEEFVPDTSTNADNEDFTKPERKNFIKRSSGSINIDEAIEMSDQKMKSSGRLNFINSVTKLIYDELIYNTKDKYNINNVGIWFSLKKDSKVYENSISLDLLKKIEDNDEAINPIFEFIKMSI